MRSRHQQHVRDYRQGVPRVRSDRARARRQYGQRRRPRSERRRYCSHERCTPEGKRSADAARSPLEIRRDHVPKLYATFSTPTRHANVRR